MTRIIICGGGLSGCLAALALTKCRKDVEVVLIEEAQSLGGNHIWSFFDTDVPPTASWLVDLIARRRWPDHEVRFPGRTRSIPIGYNSISSFDLDAAVRSALRSSSVRLLTYVSELGPRHAIVEGERIEGDCVIDARGVRAAPGLDLGWQKFLGRVYRFSKPHELARPIIMDAQCAQRDGFRFLYWLPLNATELLIEDTYYSSAAALDCERLRRELDEVAINVNGDSFRIVSEESGVLPIIVEGELNELWPQDDRVPRLGLGGGFFHPTTGYSLPDAIANALILCQQSDFDPVAIHRMLRSRAERLWEERRFFQLLNRMLFRASEPLKRYRILEHFYRLPPGLIGRFYRGLPTRLDKMRILSGKPPVPISRALNAVRRRAA